MFGWVRCLHEGNQPSRQVYATHLPRLVRCSSFLHFTLVTSATFLMPCFHLSSLPCSILLLDISAWNHSSCQRDHLFAHVSWRDLQIEMGVEEQKNMRLEKESTFRVSCRVTNQTDTLEIRSLIHSLLCSTRAPPWAASPFLSTSGSIFGEWTGLGSHWSGVQSGLVSLSWTFRVTAVTLIRFHHRHWAKT